METNSEFDIEAKALRHAENALKGVCALLPHLSGLAALALLQVDARVETACVFGSGRLLVNPNWFLNLAINDAIFVLAHELMHLALQSHARMTGANARLFNIAHDAIINDMLREELGCDIPAGGINMPGASHIAAERLVSDLRQQESWGACLLEAGWDMRVGAREGAGALPPLPAAPASQALAEAMRQAGLISQTTAAQHTARKGDVLTAEQEREWFPDDDPRDIADWQEEIREAAGRALDLGVIQAKMEQAQAKSRGVTAGDSAGLVIAQKAQHAPPWQQAMQQWIEAVTPGPRTYHRASRRGADRTDVVLAGRKREGWTLHIVLDTSGSMTESLPLVLGAIAAFCEEMNIGMAHILQCDVEVTQDELVSPDELANFRVDGFGGSDMTPAMMRLAQDPEVESAIVLTDGWIRYPDTAMPYNVLWVLDYENGFEPLYGQVLSLNGRQDDDEDEW